MRVSLLGPFQLRAEDGQTVDVAGARLRMLLARLALDAGRVVTSEVLIDDLWGVQSPTDATNALQSLVSRLRRSLRTERDMDGMVASHPAGYRLAVAPENVDVHVFERLTAEGATELRAGRITHAARTLREALDLWRGPALADVSGAPFADPVATRLSELRLSALEDRIDTDIRRGRHAEVIVELRALTREHPLRERAAGLLVKALYLAGRQADALAAYDTVRRALAEELGVDPGEELSGIHLAVLRRDDSLVPTPATQASPTQAASARLPATLTSFVGREAELAALTGLLDRSRLVTLVGPGGAGKTRLAVEAASRLDRSGDGNDDGVGVGVCFVQLAGLRESVDVPMAVLSALGLRDSSTMEVRAAGIRFSPGDVLDRLAGVLADRSCLVVLDNCEHLITAAAELVGALLDRCPRLRVLATSREPLAITGEALLPVGALELPEAKASAAAAGRAAAVRLFLDRATAVRPDFDLDADRAPAVVDICRRLDGLPLALELAAARLRSMTVAQVAERLDDRFRLLNAGSRTALPRHRTLGAVVEWSWDLLDEPERVLARRLAVFPGGATLEAAVSICSCAVGVDGDLPADEMLYLLASLVEKSLVEGIEGGDGQPRYRMLETVRAFGVDRLSEAGETDEVCARFVDHYLDLVRTADPHLRGKDQLEWLDKLTAEHDNLFAAVRTALDRGDNATAIRIAAGWGWYWILRGREVVVMGADEHSLPLNRMLESPGGAPDDAVAFLRVLQTFGDGKNLDPAMLGELAEDCRRSDAAVRYPALVLIEPFARLFSGDLDGAREALRRGMEHPDRWARAVARIGRGIAAELEGRLDDSERELTEALAEFREIGDRWGVAFTLNQLGEIQYVHGDYAGAISASLEAMRLSGQVEHFDRSPMHIARTAGKRLAAGDLDGAQRDLDEALTLCQEDGRPEVEFLVRRGLSQLAVERGDLAEARRQLDLGLRGHPGAGVVGELSAAFQVAEASLAVVEGDADRAERFLRDALHDALRDHMEWVNEIADRISQLVALRGDLPMAAFLVGASSAVRGAVNRGDPDMRRLVDSLTAALGEDTYRECFDRGAALPRDEAKSVLGEAVGSKPLS